MTGYHAFANGELLTAQKVNDYLMGQTVITVANTAARDAIGAAIHDGMIVYLEDTDRLQLRISGAWTQIWPRPANPACSLYKIATQNVVANNTDYAVNWDGEYFDSATMHDTVTNPSRIYAPVAGLYEISATLYIGQVTGMGTISFKKNGATEVAGSMIRRPGDSSSGTPLATIGSVSLAANDYVEVITRHTTGAGFAISSGTTALASAATMKRID